MRYLLFALFLFYAQCLNAQGWQWKNPFPFGDPIKEVFFVDSLNGWMTPQNKTLLKTTDGGRNWNIIHTNIIFEDIYFINKLEGWGIGREYFEKEKYSIFHTKDGGLSWEMQVADTTTVRYDIYFSDKNHGWAVGGSHSFKTVLYTKDGGKHWFRCSTDYFYRDDYVRGVVFTDSLNGWLLGGYFWALHTTDGGSTWQKDSSMAAIRKLVYSDSLHYWGLIGSKEVALSFNGAKTWNYVTYTDTSAEIWANDIFVLDNSHLYIATNLGIYFSSDSGLTWSHISNQNINSIWMLNENDGWGSGIDGLYSGFFYTNDGGSTWINKTRVNNNYGYERYTDVDFVNKTTGFIIGNLSGNVEGNFILRTDNGGDSWSAQESNTNNKLRNIFMHDSQVGWIVGDKGTILKTENGGDLWAAQISNTDMTLFDIQFIDLFNGWTVGGKLDNENENVKGVILHTTDGGSIWQDYTPFALPRLRSVCFVDSLHGWIVGGGGSNWDYGIIIRTKDGGQTWDILRSGYGLELNRVFFIDTLTGWVTGYDSDLDAKILYTNDGGLSWEGQTKSVGTIQDLVFIDNLNGWVCSYFGRIYHTENGGRDWEQQETFTSQDLFGIDFVDDSTGWAVGRYGTILHTNNGGVTSIRKNKYVTFGKMNIKLFPNYPNPFNPTTTIRFALPKDAMITLTVFDLSGKKVKTLVNGFNTAGYHQVQWNGKDDQGRMVASGMYFYVLKMGKSIKARKMFLLR